MNAALFRACWEALVGQRLAMSQMPGTMTSLGECISTSPEYCALAQSKDSKEVTLNNLESRMSDLITSLIHRPKVGYSESCGPSLTTYSSLVSAIYVALYNAET